MGYRNYISSITKDQLNDIRSCDSGAKVVNILNLEGVVDEPDEDGGDYSMWEVIREIEEMRLELGKGFELCDKFFAEGEDLFQFEVGEDRVVVITGDQLFELADHYIQITHDYYRDLLSNDDYEKSADKIKKMAEMKERKWKDAGTKDRYCILSFDRSSFNVTDSSDYEYAVFNIASLINRFDFQNNYLIFYGY